MLPDAEALAATFGRAAKELPGGAPPPTEEDLRRAAAGVAPLLRAAEDPRGWAEDLEPAVHFDPLTAFPAGVPPWPRATGAGPVTGVPGRLEADTRDPRGAEAVSAAYLARIAAQNAALGAFITVCAPDDPQARPGIGPLRGAAIAVKDIVETAGLRTTGGSALRSDRVPTRDAAAWARLRAAGAACVGKTNTQEFAAGTTTENDHFGPARNPHDRSRVAGGSSGGSAVAVAAGLCSGAIGTDTGGSVRIPAACCGVVGFKPTYGRISRAGVYALSWSLDHVGPIAGTVRDAALLFGSMAGADPEDPTTANGPALPPVETLGLPRAGGLRGLRVAVPLGWLQEAGEAAAASGGVPVSADVRRAFARAMELCRDLGAEITEADLGSADFATAVNRLIALPESAAYHARDLRARPEGFGRRVRGRMLAGRFISAEAYLHAQRLRTLLCRRYAAAMSGGAGVAGAHLIACPTLPTVAPALGASAAEGLALLRFCAPFNVVGWPAITLPCGWSAEGLPIGLQLAAAPQADAQLLAVAATVEAGLAAAATPAR